MHEILRKEFLSHEFETESNCEECPEIDLEEIIEMEKQFMLDNDPAYMSDPQFILGLDEELEVNIKQQIADYEMWETEANSPQKEEVAKWPICGNNVLISGTVVWCETDFWMHFNFVIKRGNYSSAYYFFTITIMLFNMPRKLILCSILIIKP